MCVCVYVCMSVCMYVYTHTCTYSVKVSMRTKCEDVMMRTYGSAARVAVRDLIAWVCISCSAFSTPSRLSGTTLALAWFTHVCTHVYMYVCITRVNLSRCNILCEIDSWQREFMLQNSTGNVESLRSHTAPSFLHTDISRRQPHLSKQPLSRQDILLVGSQLRQFRLSHALLRPSSLSSLCVCVCVYVCVQYSVPVPVACVSIKLVEATDVCS
jgi:hypothetical protein